VRQSLNALTVQRRGILRLGMPSKVHFYALGQETFAAALTTPGESGAPTFSTHARAEAVLLFPGSLGSL
jgi:hypothetical protein